MKTNSIWKWINGLIFLVFYIYLILQFRKVFIYYDDFGYLSLSYGGGWPGVAGSDYSFPQMMAFLGRHFFISHGRLPFLFLFLFLYMAGGIPAVQVFLATAMLLITIFSFCIVVRRTGLDGWRRSMTAVFVCLLYGTIGIMVQRSGTYWFSASFLYMAPVSVFLSFAVLYVRLTDRQLAALSADDVGNQRTPKLLFAVLPLAFFSAFAHEQWTAAVIACILMVIGRKLKKGGKFQFTDTCVILSATAGALPIFLSPAVRSRMAHNQEYMEMNLLEKILNNLRNIGNLFFTGENINYLLILILSLGCMGLYLFLTNRKNAWVHALYILFTGCVLCYVVVKLKLHWLGSEVHSTGMLVCLYLYLLYTACEVLFLFFLKEEFLLAVLFISGIFSMGCLVLTPELPLRTMLPFIFLSYTLLAYLFAVVIRKWTAACVPWLLALAVLSLPNMRQIYHGYAANYAVHMYNDSRLREASKEIKKGNPVTGISLYQNLDKLCCYEMVYDPNFSYITRWMWEYYDLPKDFTFDYRVPSGEDVIAINSSGQPQS